MFRPEVPCHRGDNGPLVKFHRPKAVADDAWGHQTGSVCGHRHMTPAGHGHAHVDGIRGEGQPDSR